MSQYLHLLCGPYQLLLDIRHVVEVGDAPLQEQGGHAVHFRRLWRDAQLPGVNLAAFLGAAAGKRRQQVVLRDADGSVSCIDVDQVARMLELGDERFAAIAGVSDRLKLLMDAVARDDDGRLCLLRLRHPFAWRADAAAEAAVMTEGEKNE